MSVKCHHCGADAEPQLELPSKEFIGWSTCSCHSLPICEPCYFKDKYGRLGSEWYYSERGEADFRKEVGYPPYTSPVSGKVMQGAVRELKRLGSKW